MLYWVKDFMEFDLLYLDLGESPGKDSLRTGCPLLSVFNFTRR